MNMDQQKSYANSNSTRESCDIWDLQDLRNIILGLFGGVSSENDSSLNKKEVAMKEYVVEDYPKISYDLKEAPVIGMKFCSLEDLYAFIIKHARHAGFSIIRKSITKS